MSDDGYKPPPPSILPLIIAGGVFLTAIGTMVAWVRIILLGVAVVVFGAIGMGFELPSYGEEALGQRGIMRYRRYRKLGITSLSAANRYSFRPSSRPTSSTKT